MTERDGETKRKKSRRLRGKEGEQKRGSDTRGEARQRKSLYVEVRVKEGE